MNKFELLRDEYNYKLFFFLYNLFFFLLLIIFNDFFKFSFILTDYLFYPFIVILSVGIIFYFIDMCKLEVEINGCKK